jgi:hypothetical protein
MGKTIITLLVGLVVGGAGALIFGGGALLGVGAGAALQPAFQPGSARR